MLEKAGELALGEHLDRAPQEEPALHPAPASLHAELLRERVVERGVDACLEADRLGDERGRERPGPNGRAGRGLVAQIWPGARHDVLERRRRDRLALVLERRELALVDRDGEVQRHAKAHAGLAYASVSRSTMSRASREVPITASRPSEIRVVARGESS